MRANAADISTTHTPTDTHLHLHRSRRRLPVSAKQIAKDIEREVIDVSGREGCGSGVSRSREEAK